MQTFNQKLAPFFENLSYQDTKLLHRAVSYLVLLDNVKLYDEMMNLLSSKEQSKALLRSIKLAVTDSYLTRSIWRSCLRVYREGLSIEESARKEGLQASDLYFVLEGLPERNLDGLINYAKTGDFLLQPLPKKEFNSIIKNMNKFCKLLVYRKLTFLYTSDYALLPEDLLSELNTKAIKLLRYYEHFQKNGEHDLLRIENYVKQGVKNYLTNFIHYNTTKKRARMFNLATSCGLCKACVANEGACTSPYDSCHVSTYRIDIGKSDALLNEVSGYTSRLSSSSLKLQEKEVYQVLKRSLDPELSKFIDIIYDKKSEDFEQWLSITKNVKIDELQDQRKLANYALSYLGISKSFMQKTLKSKYNRLGLND